MEYSSNLNQHDSGQGYVMLTTLPLVVNGYEGNDLHVENQQHHQLIVEEDHDLEEDKIVVGNNVQIEIPDPMASSSSSSSVASPNKKAKRGGRKSKKGFAGKGLTSAGPKTRPCAICDQTKYEHNYYTHLQVEHQIDVDSKRLNFDSYQEFLAWKFHIENETNHRYNSRTIQTNKSGSRRCKMFQCSWNFNRTLSERTERGLQKRTRDRVNCPAKISVYHSSSGGAVEVRWVATHVGHGMVDMARRPEFRPDPNFNQNQRIVEMEVEDSSSNQSNSNLNSNPSPNYSNANLSNNLPNSNVNQSNNSNQSSNISNRSHRLTNLNQSNSFTNQTNSNSNLNFSNAHSSLNQTNSFKNSNTSTPKSFIRTRARSNSNKNSHSNEIRSNLNQSSHSNEIRSNSNQSSHSNEIRISNSNHQFDAEEDRIQCFEYLGQLRQIVMTQSPRENRKLVNLLKAICDNASL